MLLSRAFSESNENVGSVLKKFKKKKDQETMGWKRKVFLNSDMNYSVVVNETILCWTTQKNILAGKRAMLVFNILDHLVVPLTCAQHHFEITRITTNTGLSKQSALCIVYWNVWMVFTVNSIAGPFWIKEVFIWEQTESFQTSWQTVKRSRFNVDS